MKSWTLDEIISAGTQSKLCPCGNSFESSVALADLDGVKCPECAERDRRKKECERERVSIVVDALSTIPRRYHWCQFGSPELEKRVRDCRAIDVARSAVDAERVALLGPSGAGKTVLGTCLLRAWADRSVRVLFADAISVAQARANHGLGAEPTLVVSAMRKPVLLLDDLGLDKPIFNSAVIDVLFSRHQNQLRTIVTSGFDQAQLGERYGDGIARRIFEGATVIRLSPKGST
jgi:DNA replication protein DnaC